jgi:hypothetical protein
MRKWRFILGASVIGIGAVAVACSNSSSGGGGGNEDGGDSGGTTSEGGGGGDAPACTPVDASVTTIDGGALWACFNTTAACGAELMACANDCICNSAMIAALLCVADAGGASAPANAMTTCVTQQLGMAPGAATDSTIAPLLGCLTGKGRNACEPATEGGAETGTSEGGGEGGGSEGGSEGGSDAGGG